MVPRHCSVLIQLLSGVICGCLAAEYGWLPHKEYVFTVQGQALAGLPQLKEQFTGFRYNGEMRIQSHSPRILLLKLSNMSFTKIHEELKYGWWAGPEARGKNKTVVLPTPTSAVVIKLTKTTSPELVIKSGLDDWQVNFIKGLVSKVLTYMGDNSQSSPNSNQHTSQPKDVYTVMEDSVVGRCEVLYEVNQIPKALSPVDNNLCAKNLYWEITKTRNYSNCEIVSEDHSHLPLGDCPPGGDHCGNIWTRASLTQMIGCGEKNNFVLLSSITSSMMVSELHLENNSQANINSYLNITLKSVHELSGIFNTPSKKQMIKSLLYSYSTSIKESGNVSDEEANENQAKGVGSHSYSQTNPASNKKGMDRLNKKHINQRFKRHSKASKHDFNNDNQYSNENSLGKNQYFEEDRSINHFENKTRKEFDKESWNDFEVSLESLEDQPSEEMQLEEQLEISGKEARLTQPHQPFSMFSLAHRTSYSLSCLNPKLRQLIGDIASDLEEINILPEKNTMDKVNLAVDICRSLPLDMLMEVSEEVFEVQNPDANRIKVNERKVFRDVITMCGTHPALHLIKGWLERKQVEGEEAAEIIAAIPSNIVSPTKYMVQDFFDMVKQVNERNDKQLTSTATLSLSNLVRYACVNSGARQRYFSSIVKPVCDEKLATEVTDWIEQKMDSQPHLRPMFIEALGNIGSSDITSRLRNIAMNPKYSTYHRTAAVFAMRYQALKKSAEISALLLSLYDNYKLPVSTRLAAVSTLVYSKPGLAVWQRLAISTWYEPSQAVQQFVSSTIRTMANSKDSLYSHLSKSAKLVLPLAKPARLNSHQPYNLLNSWLSNDLENIILEQISWMQFSDYANLYYRHTSRISGFSRTNLQASFETTNPDDLWTSLKDLMELSYDERRSKPPQHDIEYTLGRIKKGLGVQTRTMPELQADLHLKINDMMERMLLLDGETFKNLQKGGPKFMSDVQKEGKKMSYQKAFLNSFYISSTTEMGFPIEFSIRTPSILKARLDLNQTGNTLNVGAAFMYSAQLVSSVSVMSPWDNTAHTAGAYATNFIQLPYLEIAAKLDKPTESLHVKTNFMDQHRLLYVSMTPFTSQRKLKIHHPALLSPDTRKIKVRETVQVPIPWMSRYINSVYTSEESDDFSPMNFIRTARGVLGFPLLVPSMEARTFETVMNPLHPITMKFSMSMATKSSNILQVHSPKNTILGKIYKAWTNAGQKNSMDEKNSKPTSSSQFGNASVNIQDHMNVTQVENDKNNASADGKVNQSQNPSANTNDPEHMALEKINPDELKLKHSSEPTNRGIKLYTKTFESAVGDFNASTIDPFENQLNDSSQLYLVDSILGKIYNGHGVVVSFDLASTHQEQPVQISAFGAYATTNCKTVSRYGFFLKKDKSEVKLTAVHEDPEDFVTDLKQKLTQDLQHKFFTDCVYTHGGQTANVFFKASYGASKSSTAQLLASPHLESCSQSAESSGIDEKCQQMHSQAREIGFWNVSFAYSDEGRYFENMARMYLITARTMLPETLARPGEMSSNAMHFRIEMKRHSGTIDVYAAIPGRTLEVHNLPLSAFSAPNLLEWATQDSAPKEYCGISSDKVRTFDGGEFNHSFKNHLHLITQDCSGKYGVSVMAKPSHNKSLSFDVNIDDQFVISLTEGPSVSVNKNLQPLESSVPLLQLVDYSGHMVGHIVLTPDSSAHLRLPEHGLDLVYSGQSLIIKGESKLRGRLCGLCGAYSGSGLEQFSTPQGHPASSIAEYILSYQANDGKF